MEGETMKASQNSGGLLFLEKAVPRTPCKKVHMLMGYGVQTMSCDDDFHVVSAFFDGFETVSHLPLQTSPIVIPVRCTAPGELLPARFYAVHYSDVGIHL